MSKLLLQVGEDREDLRLDDHVERRRRLVGDHELRPQHERERDHDPLAHAARELVRVLAEARRRDAHAAERLERALLDLRVPQVALVRLQRLPEVVLDPHQRVEPRHRLLEDEADLRAPEPPYLPLAEPDEVAALVADLAGARGPSRQEADDAAAECRLPAT